MAEGSLKRVQPDIVDEVEKYEGGSFSEKLRQWKQHSNTKGNFMLTEGEFENYFDRCTSQLEELADRIEDGKTGSSNDSLTVDDVDDAVSEALHRDLPEILEKVMK